MSNTLELITPHALQKEIIKKILDPSTFFLTTVVGRQFGKTTIAENIALYWAVNFRRSKVLWVSPTDSQVQKVYKEIVNAIAHTGLIKRKTGSKGGSIIEFINGSQIQFKSALAEDNLRGESINYMIIDEAAFVKRDTVESILLPMLNVKGRKCLFITTPKGKNYIYDYFKKGLQEDGLWKSLRYSSLDSPLVNKELIKMFRETLSPALYRQEILAEFVDSTSVFNNLKELMIIKKMEQPKQGRRYYAGIDIGIVTDATVISIVDDLGNVVSYYRYVNTAAPKIIEEIVRINSIWNFEHIYIERNNQGLPILQHLETVLTNISGFDTTAKSKPQIINRLIHLFNTKNILLCNTEEMKLEFESFIFKQNSTGHIKYMADNGFHDDIVMATAIAIRCYEDNQNTSSMKVYKLGV